MYKFLSIFMCVIIICFALCACGRDKTVSDVATQAMSEVKSDLESNSNGTVADDDGKIGNEENEQEDKDDTNDNSDNEKETTDDLDEDIANSSESFT